MIHSAIHNSIKTAAVVAVLTCLCGLVQAQGSGISDVKPGSILFFNKYTSNPSTPQLQDTQINITNVNTDSGINIHMFFVDGSTCSVSDFFLGLSENQTASFLASDYDPGVQGYIVGVAVAGGPTQFNYLIGDLLIRELDGKLANLAAVGVEKLSPGSEPDLGNGTAALIFDGTMYDRLPVVAAASSFNSQVTHSTNLALYSPTANLMIGGPNNITVFTLVFDDSENPFSTTIRVPCFTQFPLISLRVAGGSINNVVPVGATGWIKLNAINRPLLGAILTRGPVFNGGHNLHGIAFLPIYTIVVPNFG